MQHLVSSISRFAAGVAALIMAGMVGLILFEVFLRTALGGTTGFTSEFVAFGFAALVFLGLAHSLDSGSLIRIDLLLSRLPERPKRAANLVLISASMAIILYVAWYVFLALNRYAVRGMMSSPSGIVPLWVPQTVVLAGIGLFCLQLAAYFIHVAAGGRYVDEEKD